MKTWQRVVVIGKHIEEITEEEAKLLALLIDTEGSISPALDNKKRYAYPHIGVHMRSVIPLVYAKKWGGYIGKGRDRDTGRLAYYWETSKQELVRSILLKIKPYLMLKKRQAELALEMLDLLNCKPEGWQEKTLELRNKIRELNDTQAPDVDLKDFATNKVPNAQKYT